MTDALSGNRKPTLESLVVFRNFADINAIRTSASFSGDRGVSACVLRRFARHKGDLVGALHS